MSENPERIINGRYRIDALIGRGGMADVYRAVDISLDRDVAVKMLRPDLARDPMFQTRFKREAQSSASLNHPNIVGVYDTGSAQVPENGDDVKTPFIVMEYVDGVTLRHILHGTPAGEGGEHDDAAPTDGAQRQGEDSDVLALTDDEQATQAVPRVDSPEISQPLQEKIDHALNQPLTEQEASGYMSGLLGALSYSHTKGIVHRDIKPSNVMIGNAGEVKVMDFGIARAVADSAQTMTQTSAVVGTAQYLSPEQARGQVVDHRSDLYSAGCVLFELLTNRPPFTGESPVSVAYQHVREDAPMVSDYNNRVSPAMESVVAKALAKDPTLRFQSAEEFDHALGNALRGIPVDDDAATTQLAAVGAGAGAPQQGSFDDVVAPGAAGVGTPLSARTPEDPDLEDYYSETQPPAKRRRGLWALLWIILLIGLLAGAGFILSRMLDSADPVTLPEVEGMERSEAVSELSDLGLDPEVETRNHADIPTEHAIGTDPDAGEDVDPNADVTLFISDGSDEVTVPDGLIGETEESARETLEEAGLEVGDVEEEDHPSIPEGEVTGTEPEGGTEIESGDSVDLTVSSGMVQLPSGLDGQVGEWQSAVTDWLSNQGFEVAAEPRWVETEDVDFDGETISFEVDGQSVSGGQQVPNTSPITIVAGYQPEEVEEEAEEAEDTDDEDDDADENGNGNDDANGNEDDDADDDQDEDDEADENGNGNGNGGNGDDEDDDADENGNGDANGNGNDDEDAEDNGGDEDNDDAGEDNADDDNNGGGNDDDEDEDE